MNSAAAPAVLGIVMWSTGDDASTCEVNVSLREYLQYASLRIC